MTVSLLGLCPPETIACVDKDGASQVVLVVKNPFGNAGDIKRFRFDPWVGRFPWRRKWQPTPVFLPGEPLEQRSLVGYHPWGCKVWDTTEAT